MKQKRRNTGAVMLLAELFGFDTRVVNQSRMLQKLLARKALDITLAMERKEMRENRAKRSKDTMKDDTNEADNRPSSTAYATARAAIVMNAMSAGLPSE